MDFTFTSEQESFRYTIRRFAPEVAAPAGEEIDGQLRRPDRALRGPAGLGVPGMVPVHHGGRDASAVGLGIAVEDLARADFVVGNVRFMAGWSRTRSVRPHRPCPSRLVPPSSTVERSCSSLSPGPQRAPTRRISVPCPHDARWERGGPNLDQPPGPCVGVHGAGRVVTARDAIHTGMLELSQVFGEWGETP
jgi:hypothetical protein